VVPAGTVQLVDTSGNVVLEKAFENGSYIFEKLSPGVYTINIIMNSNIEGTFTFTLNANDAMVQNTLVNKIYV